MYIIIFDFLERLLPLGFKMWVKTLALIRLFSKGNISYSFFFFLKMLSNASYKLKREDGINQYNYLFNSMCYHYNISLCLKYCAALFVFVLISGNFGVV